MQRQTTIATKASITKKWYVIDAKDIPLGRLASFVAVKLMGKDKPSYTPNVDCGDYIIVINCGKVALNGNNKLLNKKYYNVSGYTGGLRTRTAEVMLEKYPEEMVKRAIWGMIPKGRLGRKMIKKLFVYRDEHHEHDAQKPEVLVWKR